MAKVNNFLRHYAISEASEAISGIFFKYISRVRITWTMPQKPQKPQTFGGAA